MPDHIKKEIYKNPEYYQGETLASFIGRVKSFYTELRYVPDITKICIVAHRGVYKTLSQLIYGRETRVPKNGEVIKLGKFPETVAIKKPVKTDVVMISNNILS